ncbi:hypothetical protein Fmac_026500 [Flemingia macrophylla]|uniref:Uncharacterized protein n=1 Tax=Flemingia macrophylla TaxID=520843 RepID=A0ABD1LF30_9FABA
MRRRHHHKTLLHKTLHETTFHHPCCSTGCGDRLVGQIAKCQVIVNPENTFSVKRFVGRKMSEVDEESKQVSYRVIGDDNGNVKLDCPTIVTQFTTEEISAQVLRKLVDDASKFLNDKVTKTGVIVPVYFIKHFKN